jgi:FkbM family methyltransferase
MYPWRAEEVVHAAYNLLLSRDPEPAGLKHWSIALENGLPRAEFLRAVLASPEFREKMLGVEDLPKLQDVDLIIPIRGHQFRVPASDVSLVPHLLTHRCWEPHVMRYLTRELRPDHVFIDVGANIGYFTVLCAPLVERVIAFEPVAKTHAYCAANIALNGLTNVELQQCGLWHENTTLQITSDSSSLGSAAITRNGEAFSLESIRVASLDRLIDEGRLVISRLDVLKMDVEGAEVSALTGMRETITRFRPTIVMEVNRPMLAFLGASIDDVWAFLSDLSYQVHAFEHWNERDPDPVESLDELKRLCPPDALIDIVATDRGQI